MTIQQALQWARLQLVASQTLRPDIESLLCHVLQCAPSRLISYPEQQLTAPEQRNFVSLVEQRQQGIPVAHLTGSRGFWSLDIEVNQHTLIPRPDTELLVSLALEKIQPGMCIADLGTGSGAIALAIKAECHDIWMLATDYSQPALLQAKQNAVKNHLDVHFVRGQWLDAIQSEALDIIISNPPYIASDVIPTLDASVRSFEPHSALDGGRDGLDAYRSIVSMGQKRMKPGAWLVFEIGFDQREAVMTLMETAGFAQVSSAQDTGQRDRVVCGRR